jgi:predicted nucleotidyltransferase
MIATAIHIDNAALAGLCRANGVAKLSIFGSALRSDFDPRRSDVDVLVEFTPDARRNLLKLMKLQRDLTGLFGRTVDLSTPGSISPYFRNQVLAEAQVLYDAA